MNFEEEPSWLEYVNARNNTLSTQKSVKRSIRYFLDFYNEIKNEDLNLQGLIDKIKTENQLEIEDRSGIEKDWVQFGTWLGNDYVKVDRYCKNSKKLAPNTVSQMTALLRKFLKYYNANFPGKSVMPKFISEATERPANRKFEYRPRNIRKLVDVAKSTRDRAVILCMFQSGMDMTTLCSLNYGDMKDELEAGKIPLLFHAQRKKTHTNYRTLIGKDAIEALKIYLDERRSTRYVCSDCGASWKVRRHKCPNRDCSGSIKECSGCLYSIFS